MDIVWENRKCSDILSDCENGAVVMLKRYPESGPFLVTDCLNTVNFRLLFNLNDCTSEYIRPDERVEVLEAELHVL